IKVKLPENERHNRVEGSDLTVHVPQGSRISVGTVSARIVLSEFEGDADFQTVSGDVRISGSPKSVEVTTVSGPVTLAGKGELSSGDFKTVSGDIETEADFSS